MQTNFYFLKPLVRQLAPLLTGLELADCFSQDKDELLLGFSRPEKTWRKQRDFYLRAMLRPDFAAVSFPSSFRRATRNTIDLFPQLIGKTVQGLYVFENERAFSIVFQENTELIFKLFGNRSNLLLVQDNRVAALFNSRLPQDFSLQPAALHRPIDQSRAAFEAVQGDYRKLFPTFGREIRDRLQTPDYLRLALPERWAYLQALLASFEAPFFSVRDNHGEPELSLLPAPGESTFTDPIGAANAFVQAHLRTSGLDRRRAEWLRYFDKRISRTLVAYEAAADKLKTLETDNRYEQMGHLLMAHLHEIQPRAEAITVQDFYHDQPLEIRLKPELSPQKNAEHFYRKARNSQIEISFVKENLQDKEEELQRLEAHRAAIAETGSLKALRQYLQQQGLEQQPGKAAAGVAELFKVYNHQGYEILLGRNARNNDLLTQRYARRDDLWLHARDVSGSHVIVRQQPGRGFPAPVIERAAELAAWHSKRRTDTLCPVSMTLRKYVRKTRSLAEGQVLLDKEEVIMVTPKP